MSEKRKAFGPDAIYDKHLASSKPLLQPLVSGVFAAVNSESATPTPYLYSTVRTVETESPP